MQRPVSRRTSGRDPLPELTIRVRGLQPTTTTYEVWRNFATKGTIVSIQLFENRYGLRDGHAKIRFSPPPKEPFWTEGLPEGTYMFTNDDGLSRYEVHLSNDKNEKRSFKIQSLVRKATFYDEKMKLSPASLEFGVMLHSNSMMLMKTVQADILNDMSFVVDLLHNRIVATFKVAFRDPRSDSVTDFTSTSAIGHYDRINRYMFQIPFSQLKTIHQVDLNDEAFALVISLESPPQFLRKREDDRATHSSENPVWTEFDSWFRQTDIVYDPYRLQITPVAFQKETPVIDIGRWTTYRLVFRRSQNNVNVYSMIKQAFQDFNIEVVTLDNLDLVPPHTAQLWSLMDPPKSNHAAAELLYLEDRSSSVFLPFEVRYQLEVCISWGILNEHNITKAFLMRLAEIASKDSSKARTILEYITEQNERIYDPITIFEDKEALAYSPNTEILNYCAYSRKATITPTRVYFSSPTVEPTNRVLRHYASENHDGRFLRVQFTDEISQGRINSCANKQKNDELFTRAYRTLFNGIQIGDRRYEFLAFGNSQFRENGAYFFCPTDHLSCDDIRQWMGNFSHIKVVAKYAARLGQCFSTTRAINGLLKPDIVKIRDIERNGYCFTDGVGKISPFLAQMIAAELGLRSDTVPSAFQFRLGGCKGILVVSLDAKNKEVHIRKTQEKFTATYNGLEIIRCSQFSCATLNRQTITILSSLGVQDEVFLKMLSEQLSNYQNAMSNNKLALSLLSRYIDDNRVTINIAGMILNGFMTEREPFVLSLLHLWRAWSVKLLKEKARIIVEEGAYVLGCVDETETLRGYTKQTIASGEAFTEEHLPQIFIQVPANNDPNHYKIVEGICLVGRNPSLHPGDLRVVQAVNVPALHHLRDVVVFPQTGGRDIPSMCSGGDLDGDEYFVIWDKELQPLEWNCDPMSYAAPAPRPLDRPVEVTDLMKFFVKFMKNDSLPTIAHAHLAQSDYLYHGIKDPKCLELASLHSKAVDYVKTGQPAEMPKRLKPNKWPHFMEKKHKPKDALYHSEKILGQLYDRVERVSFVPQWKEPFDKRILRAYKLDDSVLKSARQIKRKYDAAMLRIMAQQEIKTEFEVWSTFVLSRPRVGNEYKLQEVMAGISRALKDQFRKVCIEKAGGEDFSVLGPFVAAMYRVTKEELDIALAECRSTKLIGDREVPKRKMEPESMPIISFPWLFEKELGRIATGINTSYDLDDLDLPSQIPKNNPSQSRKRQAGGEVFVGDYIQQGDGVIVHRGEELVLFHPDAESGNPSGDDHAFTTGISGEVVMDISFRGAEPHRSPQGQSSEDSGIEDVIPRTELDGFLDPCGMASPAYDSSAQPFNTQSPQIQDRKPSLIGSSVDDGDTPADPPAAESHEDIFEEEIVIEEDLGVEESLLEKLARLLET